MYTLQVTLAAAAKDRSYPIIMGEQLLSNNQLFNKLIEDRPVVLVSDEIVAPIYFERVQEALGKRKITTVILADGEANKTMAGVEQVLSAALRDRHERGSVFVALGGGVIGDMTGFAAACFLRGVDFLQLPTTLLAQVDSSVGGKTGINHSLGKNMIGAFHQPVGVIIDLLALHSLPSRQYAAGIAEIIKYGLIYDNEFFQRLLNVADKLAVKDETVLAEVIERSCAIKAEIVASDEREAGLRAILNFGHTFGHAIENKQGYGTWLHGEAVACGMVIAAKISQARNWISLETVSALTTFLKKFNLPIKAPEDMSASVFLEAMAGDKKVVRGAIRYVLLPSPGRAAVFDDVTEAEITEALS